MKNENRKVTTRDKDKYVCRPVYCERHKQLTLHTVFFISVCKENQDHILYYQFCHRCFQEDFEIHRQHMSAVHNIEVYITDFEYSAPIEKMAMVDWKHLWLGDYYNKNDWLDAS